MSQNKLIQKLIHLLTEAIHARRLALLRRLDESGWPWDREISAQLDAMDAAIQRLKGES